MKLIHFILDLAGLMLWLNWRAVRMDPFTSVTPATLGGTLKRAEPSRLKRWHFLAALAALLFLRALLYWQIGPAVNWTPKLDLGVVVLAFKGDWFRTELLFSALSFLRVLLVFYFWLLTLAMINRRTTPADAIQKVLLLQLGRAGRWPRVVQAIVPVLIVAALWAVFQPLLTGARVINPAQSPLQLLAQGLLTGVGIYFSLKFLLPVMLFAHLVASYVYLGKSPLWEFIGNTARNILAPLNRLPLRFGRVDFAPLAAIILIFLLLHTLPNLVQFQLSRRNLTIWPQ